MEGAMTTRTLIRRIYGRLLRLGVLMVVAGVGVTVGSLGTNRAALAYIGNSGLNCSGTINSQDVPREDRGTIEVSLHTQVGVTMNVAGASRLDRVTVHLGFAQGLSVVVSDTTNASNPYRSLVSVDQYASHGVGIYLLTVNVENAGNSCVGSTYIDVKGDPLQTDAGKAAAVGEGVALAGSLIGFGAGAGSSEGGTQTPSEPDRSDPYDTVGDVIGPEPAGALRSITGGMCVFFALPALLMTGMAMAGPGPGAAAPRVIHRHRWRPRLSFVALLSALIGALSTVVLLQQYGIAFPTYTVMGVVAVAWLLIGIILPSLGRKIAVNRANRREIRAEQARATATPRA
jgi:hypothetical protein